MTDSSSTIVKRRDYSNIAKLQDPTVLDDFLDEPLTFIAETITGALAAGAKGSAVAGGRIVQALLKGMLFKQWHLEFKALRDKGRIPDDFADKKYGFQTWVELMSVIDEASPDIDRLDALKSAFFAVNKVGVTDGERIVAYQLWQIAKMLTSGEILLLKAAYENRDAFGPEPNNPWGSSWCAYRTWSKRMCNQLGHDVEELVDLHEKKLAELGLLTGRYQRDAVAIENARISDLGLRFCDNLKIYCIETREDSSS